MYIFFISSSRSAILGAIVGFVLFLTPFAENRERKFVDECEVFSASEGFCSQRSEGRRYPELKLVGALSDKFKSKLNIGRWVIAISLIFLFLLTATGKSVFLSRDYFVQGLVGLVKHPFGAGGGNFNLISEDTGNQILWFTKTSSLAHNIFIEMISAVGVFATLFIYIILKLLKSASVKKSFYWILFIAVLVNFSFDYTYIIPTMTYLWFSFLGLSQKK
jgi:hypothetical protein